MTDNEKIKKLVKALQHCQKVFRSMSERGAYPRELLPFDISSYNKDEPLFLGIQGFHFIQEAINSAVPDEDEEIVCHDPS